MHMGKDQALVAAGLSLGAAAIHLAAGAEHVEALGDLGLGFYWAALFQAATAFALLGSASRRVLWITIIGNAAIVSAWTWSRIIGLPTVPGGPESIGLADAIASALQAALVILLSLRLRAAPAGRSAEGRADGQQSGSTRGLAASLGVIALSTVIAVNAAAVGHDAGHGAMTDAGHGAMTAP